MKITSDPQLGHQPRQALALFRLGTLELLFPGLGLLCPGFNVGSLGPPLLPRAV